jgi:hypothetical protein
MQKSKVSFRQVQDPDFTEGQLKIKNWKIDTLKIYWKLEVGDWRIQCV